MNESILEQLDSQIKAMRELRRKEQKKANAEQQKATDQKYKTLVQQADQYMNILSYIQENLGFVCSAELVAGLRTFFHKLESAVCYGDAEKEAVSQATDMVRLAPQKVIHRAMSFSQWECLLNKLKTLSESVGGQTPIRTY